MDGSGVDRNLVRAFGLSVFTGVAADNRHVHWVDFATGRIMRARHNGTGVRTLVRGLGVASIHDVAVDDQYVYWTNAERSLIGRARLNGRQANERFIVLPPSAEPSGLAVSGDLNGIYWTDSSGLLGFRGSRIGRANLDGSDANNSSLRLLIRGALATDVAVSPDGLFWTDHFGERVGRANPDGSNVNTNFVPASSARTSLPSGIAVDGAHVYWGDLIGRITAPGNSISRVKLDGSSVERQFVPSANRPWGVAVERAPLISAKPGRIEFGGLPVNTGPSRSRATIVENVGNWPLQVFSTSLRGADGDQFAITSDGCSGQALPPGATCDIGSAFSPTTPGGKQANLLIQSNSVKGPNKRVRLRGVGTQAAVTISPTDTNYGGRPVGAGPSAPVDFTVSNNGDAPLVVGTVSLAGSNPTQFDITSDNCTGTSVSPGGSCDIGVAFDPSTAGDLQGSLRVPTNDPTAPVATAGLEGRGVTAAGAIAPRSADFGTVDVDRRSDPKTFTVTSVGDAPLDVTRVQLSGADAGQFSITGTTCNGVTLPPGRTCETTIRFAPTESGDLRAELEVVADDPGLSNPAAVAAISGNGRKPGPPNPHPTPPFPPNPPFNPVNGCGVPEITSTAGTGGTTRQIAGVEQRFVTRDYNGDWAARGTTRCASGMVINLYGPLLNRRSAVRLAERGDQQPVQKIAQATISRNGDFSLPAQARPAGQYFVALGDSDPLSGAPIWVRVRPTGTAVPRGAQTVQAFFGPPQATEGEPVVLQQLVGGAWRNFSRGTVDRRARVDLPAPPSGRVRAVIEPADELLITRRVFDVQR